MLNIDSLNKTKEGSQHAEEMETVSPPQDLDHIHTVI